MQSSLLKWLAKRQGLIYAITDQIFKLLNHIFFLKRLYLSKYLQ